MKHITFIFILSVSLLSVVSSTFAGLSPEIKKINSIKQQEPSFEEILSVFLRKENLTEHELVQWQKKIKASAFLPKMYLGYDHQSKEAQSLSIGDNISISGGNITIGPEENNIDFDNNLGQTFRVRLMWDLDQIIFHRDLLSLQKQKQSLAHSRFALSEKLFQVYQSRYAALVEYLRYEKVSRHKAMVFYTRFLLLTDRLNEVTDRHFESMFWKGN